MSAISRREPTAHTPQGEAHPEGTAVKRRPSDLVWLGVGAALLLLSALPVHARSISDLEAAAFRLINDLPSVPFAVVWVPMQLGNLLVVPAAVLVALAFRRFRLAIGLALAGAGVYALPRSSSTSSCVADPTPCWTT
jgi:hypothetical protein